MTKYIVSKDPFFDNHDLPKTKLLFSVTIKDCEVSTFTVGGHGGAGKDTSNTGVQVTHRPSGATGRSTETRSQLKNKQTAFKRMAESKKFQTWARTKATECNPSVIELMVEESMDPKNLKIEVRDENGKWAPVKQIGEYTDSSYE